MLFLQFLKMDSEQEFRQVKKTCLKLRLCNHLTKLGYAPLFIGGILLFSKLNDSCKNITCLFRNYSIEFKYGYDVDIFKILMLLCVNRTFLGLAA